MAGLEWSLVEKLVLQASFASALFEHIRFLIHWCIERCRHNIFSFFSRCNSQLSVPSRRLIAHHRIVLVIAPITLWMSLLVFLILITFHFEFWFFSSFSDLESFKTFFTSRCSTNYGKNLQNIWNYMSWIITLNLVLNEKFPQRFVWVKKSLAKLEVFTKLFLVIRIMDFTAFGASSDSDLDSIDWQLKFKLGVSLTSLKRTNLALKINRKISTSSDSR